MIEFDVETTSLQWYGEEQRVFLAQFLQTGMEAPVLHPLPEGREATERWLRDADEFRAWNAKFDLHWLAAEGFELPPESSWHDGMVAAHIVDERTSVSLKARGARLFGEGERGDEKAVADFLKAEAKRRREASKATGERYVAPNYSDVPDSIMHPYAARDVDLQQRVCAVTWQALKNQPELMDVYELERGVLAGLFRMEERGLPIDREAAVRLEAKLEEDHERLESECRQLAGIETFNPRSPAQISEALQRKVPKDKLKFATPNGSGGIKTDEENLRAIAHPLAAKVLEYRGTAKMYGMLRAILHGKDGDTGFPSPYLGSDDRLHPNFRQVGARTGRMSCSDPNIQQWHRDDLRMRYLVSARPGYKLVTADLDAIEMRMFAAFCGDGVMRDAILRGEDMHQMAADAASFSDRRRPDGSVESSRQQGKTLNYEILYGAGVRSLRKAHGVNTDGAKEILRRYHRQFPEVGDLQGRIEYALSETGYVKSPWGRRFRATPGKAWQESYKFTNYLVQGSSADLLKAALVEVHKQGVPLIAAVHDELVAEVPEEDAEEAARIIQKALTDHPRITEKVPLEAEADIIDRWSDAKTPGFKPDYAT